MLLNWFKSNLISLGIICALLVYIIFNQYHHTFKQETSKTQDTLKPVLHYTDSKGDSWSRIPIQIVTDKKEFKKAVKPLEKDIKGNNTISEVTTFTENLDTIFKTLKVDTTIDSIISFEKVDSFINAKAKYNKLTHLGEIDIRTRDTLTYVVEVNRHLFRKDELNIDIRNKNPYSKIQYGNSIILKEANPLIDFCIFAGYNPFNHKVQFAIGAGLHIWSIKTRH